MAATFEFNQAVGKIHFQTGTNEQGGVIRKVKTYRNVASGAGADELYTALTALASLSIYPMMKAEKAVTEDIQN